MAVRGRASSEQPFRAGHPVNAYWWWTPASAPRSVRAAGRPCVRSLKGDFMIRRLTCCTFALLLVACGGDAVRKGSGTAAEPLTVGIATATAGDAEAALPELRKAAQAAPDDIRPLLWMALLNGGTAGLDAFRERTDFDRALARWALHEIEDDELLVEAGSVEDAAERAACRAQARFYLGLAADRNDKPEEARRHYEACVHLQALRTAEHGWATGRLHVLGPK
jgi:hypothetical protein